MIVIIIYFNKFGNTFYESAIEFIRQANTCSLKRIKILYCLTLACKNSHKFIVTS